MYSINDRKPHSQIYKSPEYAIFQVGIKQTKIVSNYRLLANQAVCDHNMLSNSSAFQSKLEKNRRFMLHYNLTAPNLF